jgi:dienelactone hydrolase
VQNVPVNEQLIRGTPATPVARVALLSLLLGVGPGCPAGDEPPAWCTGSTLYDYAPDRATSLTTMPDDHWTVPAPTLTGLRVHLEIDQTPALQPRPGEEGYFAVYDELSLLDGFGTTSGITFRFVRTVDEATLAPEDYAIVALPDGGAPIRIAADHQTSDFGATIILRPRTPLPPGTRVGAAVFTSALGWDGTCIAPSRYLRELLSPETELDDGVPPHDLSLRFVEVMDALEREPHEIAAMTAFTTQSATDHSRRVAADIVSRPADTPTMTCAEEAAFLVCDGTLPVDAYVDAAGILVESGDATPVSRYDLPLRAWLPLDRPAEPLPVVFFGHGLGGDRGQAGRVARSLGNLEVAVIAVDAVEHGDHPLRTPAPIEFIEPLMFFGISLDPAGIQGRKLRDNLRQSTFDKLQVVRSLRAGMDVDGDGFADFDGERMLYIGASLGGLMGPELLALTDAFAAAMLAVPGGRITSLLHDSESLGVIVDALRPDATTDGDIDRFFPILQAVVDPGDPMTWAPYVLHDRLDASPPPQLLMEVAQGDAIIPNAASDALARSLGLPGVARALWEIADIEFEAAPLTGNLPGGGTAGLLLFDTVTDSDAPDSPPAPAEHGSVPGSEESRRATEALFRPAIDGLPGTIIDPYAR